jgi:hypothetical protein
LRVSQNGSTWLELGVLANGIIQPVELVRQSGQPARVPVRAQNSASAPNVGEMDLQTVQTYRQKVAAKLQELETNINRVISLRNQNRQNEQLTIQYNTELSRYTREQNEWRGYDGQLEKRLEEIQRARQAGSSGGSGMVFGCGTLLAGLGIIVFSRLVGFPIDFRAFMFLALIALASGLLTLFIAQLD